MEEKSPQKLTKGILNIIRTTMRNNIELTNIADNKANVLLSLSALMITFLVPFLIPHFDTIRAYKLIFPLSLLVLTCFVTIYLAAIALMPGKFKHNKTLLKKGQRVSPFYFGNSYQMNRKDFRTYLEEGISDPNVIKNHITEDLHYVGARLGHKMSLIRLAFIIFMVGFFTSISTAIVFLFIFGN